MSAKSTVRIPVVTIKGHREVPHYTVAKDGEDVTIGWGRETSPTEWIRDPEWVGTLRATSYHSGRSSSCYSVCIEVEGELPVVGLMSCSMFYDLLPRLANGKVTGKWTARKQGGNYMIREA